MKFLMEETRLSLCVPAAPVLRAAMRCFGDEVGLRCSFFFGRNAKIYKLDWQKLKIMFYIKKM